MIKALHDRCVAAEKKLEEMGAPAASGAVEKVLDGLIAWQHDVSEAILSAPEGETVASLRERLGIRRLSEVTNPQPDTEDSAPAVEVVPPTHDQLGLIIDDPDKVMTKEAAPAPAAP